MFHYSSKNQKLNLIHWNIEYKKNYFVFRKFLLECCLVFCLLFCFELFIVRHAISVPIARAFSKSPANNASAFLFQTTFLYLGGYSATNTKTRALYLLALSVFNWHVKSSSQLIKASWSLSWWKRFNWIRGSLAKSFLINTSIQPI